jgi:hypothetical protein
MENGYLIVVDTTRSHPNFEKIIWKQEENPKMDKILEKIKSIAIEKHVPLDFLEQYGVLAIEAFDNGVPFDPHVFKIVFLT